MLMQHWEDMIISATSAAHHPQYKQHTAQSTLWTAPRKHVDGGAQGWLCFD